MHYGTRINPVTVTLADGLANEGEAGENDRVTSVELATGGAGNDLLVSTSAANTLRGGGGNDQLSGGGAADKLYGDGGDDYLIGEAGADTMYGGTGNDTLVGDPAGTDVFRGEAGDDTIVDNTDGRAAETVDCGDGAGTAESDSEDTLTACENLVPP